ILSAEDVTFELVRELQLLEPYGAGNPRPVFLAHNLRIMSEPRLIGGKHLKVCALADPKDHFRSDTEVDGLFQSAIGNRQ
ncbi:MAG: hypothetical protein ABR568_23840, partial [Pyrinomonadaceae bacterium]